ncbi:NADH-quinone oxidoreductase subunit C [Paracidobacterium acidisoli]|nr:NADH-quinone oxidoreductase subunit C [Paracidobacterium acidisoli]MBT9329862.1 NADH-quinone oxidoreductase subunit C [Paracidobacterium acidisoli]
MTQAISVEEIKAAMEAAVPGCRAEILRNESPSAQHSLLIDHEHAVNVAAFLRDDMALRLDFCSCVSGVDWPDREITEKVKVKKTVTTPEGEAQEQDVEETRKTMIPGFLEAVYHLFSIEKKHGPVVLRMRTVNRGGDARLPSLTPVWRSAEFQEREAFDLYGIVFEGHPDLRRILMWEGFADYPMRKDYVPPAEDDVEAVAK